MRHSRSYVQNSPTLVARFKHAHELPHLSPSQQLLAQIHQRCNRLAISNEPERQKVRTSTKRAMQEVKRSSTNNLSMPNTKSLSLQAIHCKKTGWRQSFGIKDLPQNRLPSACLPRASRVKVSIAVGFCCSRLFFAFCFSSWLVFWDCLLSFVPEIRIFGRHHGCHSISEECQEFKRMEHVRRILLWNSVSMTILFNKNWTLSKEHCKCWRTLLKKGRVWFQYIQYIQYVVQACKVNMVVHNSATLWQRNLIRIEHYDCMKHVSFRDITLAERPHGFNATRKSSRYNKCQMFLANTRLWLHHLTSQQGNCLASSHTADPKETPMHRPKELPMRCASGWFSRKPRANLLCANCPACSEPILFSDSSEQKQKKLVCFLCYFFFCLFCFLCYFSKLGALLSCLKETSPWELSWKKSALRPFPIPRIGIERSAAVWHPKSPRSASVFGCWV